MKEASDYTEAEIEAILLINARKDPSPSEIERARKANEELAKMAAGKTEEELEAWRQEHIYTKRHKYRSKDKHGNVHMHEHHHPKLTHHIIIRHANGSIEHNYADADWIAKKIVKSVTMSEAEHLKEIQRHKDRLLSSHTHMAEQFIALHERLAKEADGKAAEVYPMEKIHD